MSRQKNVEETQANHQSKAVSESQPNLIESRVNLRKGRKKLDLQNDSTKSNINIQNEELTRLKEEPSPQALNVLPTQSLAYVRRQFKRYEVNHLDQLAKSSSILRMPILSDGMGDGLIMTSHAGWIFWSEYTPSKIWLTRFDRLDSSMPAGTSIGSFQGFDKNEYLIDEPELDEKIKNVHHDPYQFLMSLEKFSLYLHFHRVALRKEETPYAGVVTGYIFDNSSQKQVGRIVLLGGGRLNWSDPYYPPPVWPKIEEAAEFLPSKSLAH